MEDLKLTDKMVGRKRVSFKAIKIIKKPVIVKFRRSDGSVVKFKTTKAVRQLRRLNPTRLKRRKKKR